ncbi:MAG: type II toxin-antitoxin system YafQ family toxin [Defluviitaleaceae bacterium]|nr:type II toxin-antitoxin system YafQ family toxin [Defluviitaleaceae bacterium]MCL2276216.1 type II toxin-antitoxin system YafQ family toxin [Defluviitaleaceae bacterium]
MYKIDASTKFKRNRRLLVKWGYNLSLLDETIRLLASGNPLPSKYRDHALTGNYVKYRECHVDGQGDWLLIYKKFDDTLLLLLTETGTHSDLFK